MWGTMRKNRKKQWGFMIAAIILLNGCGMKNEKIQSEVNTISDWNPAYQTDSPYQFAVGAENGYYFAMFNYLYYMDKNQTDPVILCNKPNCPHDGTECNAYFPQSIPQITYCNGYIYGFEENSVGGSQELTAVSGDGETKETLLKVEHRDINEFLVHQDWCFYVVNDGAIGKLVGYDIKNREEKTLYSVENEGSGIGGLFFWNDFLYFYATTVDETENGEYRLLRYDWNENSILEMNPKDENGLTLNYPAVVWAEADTLFVTGISDDGERRVVYTSALDGTNVQMEIDVPNGGIVMDGTYVYVQYWAKERIDIYDRNSTCVQILSGWRGSEYNGLGLAFLESGSDQWAFLYEAGLKKNDDPISERSVWVLDKSMIGSGECQFQQILSSNTV